MKTNRRITMQQMHIAQAANVAAERARRFLQEFPAEKVYDGQATRALMGDLVDAMMALLPIVAELGGLSK